MTWQKIIPLFLISYYFNFNIIIFAILASALIGAINGLNQTSLKKLIAFSSINHLSWILIRIIFNETLWTIYFLNYFILNLPIVFLFHNFKIFQFNQLFNNFLFSSSLKLIIILNFLSLGGLPPFIGFFPKWIVIESLIYQNQYFLLWYIIIFSLITLYFYARISTTSLIFNSITQSWIINLNFKNNFLINLFFIFSSISIFGLFFNSFMHFIF
jgi:NADH-ubiquinone oxidoreductase chain 2